MSKGIALALTVCAAVALSLGLAMAAYAYQQSATAPEMAAEQIELPPPTMTQLADGVYQYFGFFTSSLVVIDGGQVLITDPSNPFRAQSLRDEIAKVTDAPVSTIALTHEHYDHAGGTELFPDAHVICHRNCQPIFDLSSLGDVPQVDEVFDDFKELRVGDKVVELHYLGPSDGNANVVVYMPAEQIVLVTDLYEPRALTHKNWVDDKNFVGVQRVLNTVSRWDITYALTAHEPGTDPAHLRENAAYYTDLYDATYDAINKANAESGIGAVFGLFDTLPQTLELEQYQDWENYDTSFPRHVERMLLSIYHGD